MHWLHSTLLYSFLAVCYQVLAACVVGTRSDGRCNDAGPAGSWRGGRSGGRGAHADPFNAMHATGQMAGMQINSPGMCCARYKPLWIFRKRNESGNFAMPYLQLTVQHSHIVALISAYVCCQILCGLSTKLYSIICVVQIDSTSICCHADVQHLQSAVMFVAQIGMTLQGLQLTAPWPLLLPRVRLTHSNPLQASRQAMLKASG